MNSSFTTLATSHIQKLYLPGVGGGAQVPILLQFITVTPLY